MDPLLHYLPGKEGKGSALGGSVIPLPSFPLLVVPPRAPLTSAVFPGRWRICGQALSAGLDPAPPERVVS
jgi:hypothetical protein